MESFTDFPSAKATQKAPQKQSPAPVVSKGLFPVAGTRKDSCSSQKKAPRLPRVIITFFTPLVKSTFAAFSAETSSETLTPVKYSDSVSLGMK